MNAPTPNIIKATTIKIPWSNPAGIKSPAAKKTNTPACSPKSADLLQAIATTEIMSAKSTQNIEPLFTWSVNPHDALNNSQRPHASEASTSVCKSVCSCAELGSNAMFVVSTPVG